MTPTTEGAYLNYTVHLEELQNYGWCVYTFSNLFSVAFSYCLSPCLWSVTLLPLPFVLCLRPIYRGSENTWFFMGKSEGVFRGTRDPLNWAKTEQTPWAFRAKIPRCKPSLSHDRYFELQKGILESRKQHFSQAHLNSADWFIFWFSN